MRRDEYENILFPKIGLFFQMPHRLITQSNARDVVYSFYIRNSIFPASKNGEEIGGPIICLSAFGAPMTSLVELCILISVSVSVSV